LWLGVVDHVAADVTEIREFAVQVDGRPVGTNQLVITNRDDGTTLVSNRSNVQVKMLLTYTFSYQGTEVWQNYRLLQLDGHTDDNRRRFDVRAVLDNETKSLRLRVNNGEEHVVPADSWSTSYWKLPEARFFNQNIPVVDAGKGDFIQGRLQYVGTEQRPVSGQLQKLYHFRIEGGKSPVDLWYDMQHHLVRREFLALGHRTVIELTSIQR
jgi:hypothetical protein